MGVKGRLLRQAVKMGLVEPRALKGGGEVKSVATPIVRTKCPDITNWTEIKTCKQIMGLLNMPRMPQHIIREKAKEGMRKVIAKLEKAGETKECICRFDWDMGEVRTLWTKLGYSEGDWHSMCNGDRVRSTIRRKQND